MSPQQLLALLKQAEKLKDTTRHCYTSQGRKESVAEHSWMMALMAIFLSDEFPEVDWNKVIKMCIIHDLGESFIGDIPAFEKTATDRETENTLLMQWIQTFPSSLSRLFENLIQEMLAQETIEANLFKAIDSLEALVQHNLSDLATWTEDEKQFNLNYAVDRVQFSPYLKGLREQIRQESLAKLNKGSNQEPFL